MNGAGNNMGFKVLSPIRIFGRYKWLWILVSLKVMTTQLIDKLFSRLDDWRHLPSYQLERRADIFFSIYLDDIIKSKFNHDIEFVVPEFPVRLGDIYPNIVDNSNRSFKIDYVAVCNKTQKVFLIELKTDDGSRRNRQDKYLEKAKENNVKKLVGGILQIRQTTSSKKKYDNLISLLSKIGWIDESTMTATCEDYDIEIVYIQPNIGNADKNIISFADIVSILSHRQDELTQRFVKSLTNWTPNPN